LLSFLGLNTTFARVSNYHLKVLYFNPSAYYFPLLFSYVSGSFANGCYDQIKTNQSLFPNLKQAYFLFLNQKLLQLMQLKGLQTQDDALPPTYLAIIST